MPDHLSGRASARYQVLVRIFRIYARHLPGWKYIQLYYGNK